jgi:hypothetical protein
LFDADADLLRLIEIAKLTGSLIDGLIRGQAEADQIVSFGLKVKTKLVVDIGPDIEAEKSKVTAPAWVTSHQDLAMSGFRAAPSTFATASE